MRVAVSYLLLNCLVLSVAAKGLRQQLRRTENNADTTTKATKSAHQKDKEGKSENKAENSGRPGHTASSQDRNGHSGAPSSGSVAAQGSVPGYAAASASGTISASEGSQSWAASATTNATNGTNARGSTTAPSMAATASQVTKIAHDKINMTLSEMPYKQIMCKNSSQVQSGSVINATWLSKGAYTNTVYLRYGLDNYSAWNTAPGGTLPPFAGEKVKDGKTKKDNDTLQDPDATYRMTFQTQVFAYQKGLVLSILLYDNQKGASVVTFESPTIEVKDVCERKKEEAKDSGESADGVADSQSEGEGEDEGSITSSVTKSASRSASAPAETETRISSEISSTMRSSGIVAVANYAVAILAGSMLLL